MKTPHEKQIKSYVDTIAELNREVAKLKKFNTTVVNRFNELHKEYEYLISILPKGEYGLNKDFKLIIT